MCGAWDQPRPLPLSDSLLQCLLPPAPSTSASARLLAPEPLQVNDALLKATELRLAGNAAAQGGDLGRALKLYTQGLELNVGGMCE